MADPYERNRVGLLDYLTTHALDEDYAYVSARDGGDRPSSRPSSRPSRRHLPSLVVLLLFGALLATAAVQTARSEPTRESSKESLVAQAKDRRTQLADARARVARLRKDVDEAQQSVLSTTGTGRAVRQQLDRLGVTTGYEAATGPGVRIVVDDAPDAASDRQRVLDKDLQILVNGLWNAGAEAIAINGQRLTNLTAIRVAGSAITVNLRSLSRPYVVNAIGDPDQLPARFVDSAGGAWWLNLRSVYHLRFDMSSEESITVPAAPDFTLRHVSAADGDTGGGR